MNCVYYKFKILTWFAYTEFMNNVSNQKEGAHSCIRCVISELKPEPPSNSEPVYAWTCTLK